MIREGALVRFSLRHLNPSERVRFHFALKGRNQCPGMFQRLGLETLGRAVLAVPDDGIDELRMFLSSWRCAIDVIPFRRRSSWSQTDNRNL